MREPIMLFTVSIRMLLLFMALPLVCSCSKSIPRIQSKNKLDSLVATNEISSSKFSKSIGIPTYSRGNEKKLLRSSSIFHSNLSPGMKKIPGGTFLMGSPPGEGHPNEHPQHPVTINEFFMDSTEVTQAQFYAVMGFNPSHFKECPDCPVDSVSWIEAHEFCSRVGKRLPTQAQWEYAARAGSSTKYPWGDSLNNAYAWHFGNSDLKTHPVGQKKPNLFGLHDMIGNVWEFCADWCSDDYYQKKIFNNPQGPDSGQFRNVRGGGFGYNNEGDILRCAYRNAYAPDYRNINVGFRCCK